MSEKISDILLQLSFGSKTIDDFPALADRRGEDKKRAIFYLDQSGSSIASGLKQTENSIRSWLKINNTEADFINTGSMGAFALNPLIGIKIPGRACLFFGPVNDYQVDNLLEAVFNLQIPQDLIIGQLSNEGIALWEGIPLLDQHPFFAHQERRLMALHGIIDPDSLEDYVSRGGYLAFVNSLMKSTPDHLFNLLSECEVRGRSGSGFPLIKKWKMAMDSLGKEIHLVCNADESDPGGFMHRLLIEGNPHLVFEGMMLSAYIAGCSTAIIYTRNRYRDTVSRLENALSQLKNAGLVGRDIMDSGFNLEIEIRKGPGAFICGEETALIASIEGRRGMPNPKPPYPSEKGLYGQPTIIHNVETIAQVPLIISRGSEWYNSIGSGKSRGTKLLSLSGRFANHGVVEVPMGIPLDTIIKKIGGLPGNQKEAKALLVGGPSGLFIHPDEFKARLDFDELHSMGLVMGSGSMILLDTSNCVVEMTEHLMSFIQDESCGKCIPCREGTRRMADIIKLITHPNTGDTGDTSFERTEGIDQLKALAGVIAETSLCGLGKNAPGPLISSIQKFGEDWERHLNDRVCQAGVCTDLRTFYIDANTCTGCYLCLNKCPEMAIVGSPRQVHVIIEEKCTGCGICYEVCKFNAIATR